MLVEDTTAFVEQLEVSDEGKRVRRRRRRVLRSELAVLTLQSELRLASEALELMERERSQQRGISWTASRGAGRLRQWWLQREMAAIRARHKTKRRELAVEQERLNRVRQEYSEHDELRKRGRMFRLHSAEHHLACSERRFARLFASQLVFPVLVTRRSGRKWWWYLDRFWWDDEGLRARDVETIVLQSDLRARQQADAQLYARASVLGDVAAFRPELSIPELVCAAVWRRHLGRCVDCGSDHSVVFERIVPVSMGGSDRPRNVELRCRSCRDRFARNEARKRVSRAQIEATPYYRGERATA